MYTRKASATASSWPTGRLSRKAGCERRTTHCASGPGNVRSRARGDGSDAVQRLDLRHVEAVCGPVADGTPGADESHRRVQEKERQAGCAEDRRPGALQLTAGVLRGAGGDPRAAADAALPQPGGSASDAHEEQGERVVNGGGRGVQQAATAREAILHGTAGHFGRSAGVGERSAAAEPRRAGDFRDDAGATGGTAAKRAVAGPASAAAEEHTGRGASDVADLDSGGRRSAAVLFGGARGELLRVDFGAGLFGRQATTGTDLETAQRTFANGADRGGETGAAVESAIGSGTRAGGGAGESQPGHSGGGAEAGGVSVGGGQIRPAVPAPHPLGGRNGGRESGVRKSSKLTSGKTTTEGVPHNDDLLAIHRPF